MDDGVCPAAEGTRGVGCGQCDIPTRCTSRVPASLPVTTMTPKAAKTFGETLGGETAGPHTDQVPRGRGGRGRQGEAGVCGVLPGLSPRAACSAQAGDSGRPRTLPHGGLGARLSPPSPRASCTIGLSRQDPSPHPPPLPAVPTGPPPPTNVGFFGCEASQCKAPRPKGLTVHRGPSILRHCTPRLGGNTTEVGAGPGGVPSTRAELEGAPTVRLCHPNSLAAPNVGV